MMVGVRLVSLAACGLACALATAASAGAHISVTPGLLVAGDTQPLRLIVHNDLDRPMTGLAVIAPAGLRIVAASADGPWRDVVENGAVTWSGGPLAPNTGAAFALEVAVDEATAAGPVQIQAEQLYPNDGKLPWPISVTVIPGDEESQLLTWAIVGGIGLLVTGGLAVLALQRRGQTLQER